MAVLTVEISDASKEFMDREIVAGNFKDCNALVQAALKEFMRTQWKANADKLISEALDEYERGEYTEWQPGDFGRMGREYLAEKRAKEKQQ